MNNKMKSIVALKIWVVIYPSLLVLQIILKKWLYPLSLLVRTLVLTGILVPWVIFAGLPFLNFLIGKIKMREKI